MVPFQKLTKKTSLSLTFWISLFSKTLLYILIPFDNLTYSISTRFYKVYECNEHIKISQAEYIYIYMYIYYIDR